MGMKIFRRILIIYFLLISEIIGQNLTANNRRDFVANTVFELPDLTKIISTETGEFQIEAYKSILNDQIIKSGNKTEQSQLFWVSMGNVKLLKKVNNGTSQQLFYPQPDGYYVYVQTLTEQQRQILAETANSKYNVQVKPSQIVNLILSKFSCVINLADQRGERSIIKGEVENFHNFPLRMDFWMPGGSKERNLFEKRLDAMKNDHSIDLKLSCFIASSGQQVKTNTLTINGQLSERLGIVDKLFGPSNSMDSVVYVTREQLAALAGEIYSSLSVVEVYEMPETQFSETFVEELLKQVSSSQFQPVSFDQSLEKLSKYTTDFSLDLKPDEIKRDLGNILALKKVDNKSQIIVNEEFMNSLVESGKIDSKQDGSFSFAKLFKIGGSVKFTRDHSRDWRESGKSLDDQLRQLNTETADDVKWKIEGNRIIPKSLNVARISRSNFQKTLVFQRVRRQYIDAPFQRDIAIYITQALIATNKFEEIKAMLSSQESSLRNAESQIAVLKNANNDMNGKLGSANTKISSLENVIGLANTKISILENVLNQKVNEISHLQNGLNGLNGRVLQFTGSSHCILANGNCPPGYTSRHNAFIKAIQMYSRDPSYIKMENFGSSYIRCHGDPEPCGWRGDWVAEIELVTCCK